MASQLSPRQREILDLVAEGRTSKEIAVTLGISESTVNWHLANAFERLGASSRAEAVALAIRSNGASNGAAPVAAPPPQVAPTPTPTAWPRLAAIAIAIAIAGALLGGATVATFHLGQAPSPTASPANGAATSSPASDSGSEVVGGESQPLVSAEPAANTTVAPSQEPSSTLPPLPILSAAPVPTVPLTPLPSVPALPSLPVAPTALPTLPVTPPALPTPSLPPLPLPTPSLPIR